MFLFWLTCVPTLCIIMAVIEYVTDDLVPRADETRSRRWPTNLTLMVMNVGLALVIPFTTISMALLAQANGLGLFNLLDVPFAVAFVLSYVYLSFHIWALHLALHSFAVLWRFHRVHHADYDVDFTSTFRSHPVEVVISAFTGAAAALCLGLDPFAAFASSMTIILMSIVTHSRIALPKRLEQFLQIVFVTPGMHHLHHSNLRVETHSNFGGDLSVWDRLFGTLRSSFQRDMGDFAYGLKSDPPEKADDLDWLLVTPFRSGK